MLVCPLMWKTDISSAYRRCPLRPQHQQYHAAVFACDGVTHISQQRSLSFGAIASVWGFHRVGNFLLALARQRWMIIAMRYVDDFFGLGRPGVAVGPGRMCSIIFGAFGWMCDMEKTTDFQEALVVLGAKCFISWSRRSVSLSVAHDKLTRWLKTIDIALASGVLVPSEAMKLVGRLSWTATLVANRCGRAFLKALHAQIHQPTQGFRVSHWLDRCLRWWRAFLLQQPVLWRGVATRRPHVVTWCDAAGKTRMAGAIVFINERWYWTRWLVPQWMVDQFCPREDNYIGLLELVGVVLTWSTFKTAIAGSFWTAYCDNSGVVHGCANGSTNGLLTNDVNNMIGRFWLEIAKADVSFFIAQVETDANGSDEVTRVQVSQLVEKLEAEWVAPVVPQWFENIWQAPDAIFDGIVTDVQNPVVIFD